MFRQEISTNLYVITILSSTVIATMVGVILNWIKEFFQNRKEKEERGFEKLYGYIIYHLLAIRVLSINRDELIKEISNKPIPDDTEFIIKRFADVNPVNAEWKKHVYKLKEIFESNAGYIKKQHIKLVEDLLDGFVKRDITDGGRSGNTTKERIEKLFDAIDSLQKELL